MLIAGLDIGGTKCAAILGRIDGNRVVILGRRAFATADAPEPTACVARLCASVRELAADQVEQIQAVGVVCGGPLDATSGVVLGPPNLPGWDRVAVVDQVTAALGVPARLENDANACALAEWRWGAGRGTHTFVYLTMGTGMGAGVVIDGKLHRGATGNAGELGHWRLAAEGPVGYGKAGSFEGFCSGGGMARLATMRGFVGSGVSTSGDAVTAETLCTAARAGDPIARVIIDEIATHLGEGLALLADVLDPERVALGGVFMRAWDLMWPTAQAVIAREALPGIASRWSVVPAGLGEQVGDYAALVIAEELMTHNAALSTFGSAQFAHSQLASAESAAPESLIPASLIPESLIPASAASASSVNHGAATPRDARTLSAPPAGLAQFAREHPTLASLIPVLSGAVNDLIACHQRGGTVLVCGNGGSASDADHIVGELMKGFRLPRPLPTAEMTKLIALDPVWSELGLRLQQGIRAQSLVAHTALTSAIANDNSPDLIFAQQVHVIAKPGDIFIGLSTSGGSRNVVRAAEVARARGVTVFAFTGSRTCALGALAHRWFAAPAVETYRVQECHLPLYHALCWLAEEALFGAITSAAGHS